MGGHGVALAASTVLPYTDRVVRRLPRLLGLVVACGLAPSTVALVVGCEQTPVSLTWTVSFEDAVGSRVQTLDLSVLAGACDGRVLRQWDLPRGEAPGAVANLAPGTYAFRARARDGACQWIAERCDVVSLPTTVALTQRLAGLPMPVAVCPPDECVGGACGLGGDAGPRDAGEHMGFDAGPLDAGGATGPCAGRGDATACVVGGVAGTCWLGACCVGCWDGTACLGGAMVDACGHGGARCVACTPECQACGATGCENVVEGTSCSGGYGQCGGGICCLGCRVGPTCYAGTDDSLCETYGYPCMDCGGFGCNPADPTPRPYWPCY